MYHVHPLILFIRSHLFLNSRFNAVYTMPWAIIALATLRKPATFAPFT